MKVFSKEKYIKNMGKDAYNGVSKKWVDQCDGKTVEECGRMGFGIADSWLVDVPRKKELAGRKFRCIGYNAGERLFTFGKVYEIGLDGSITNDRGFTYRYFPGNAIDWLKAWYEFEEVTDEKKHVPEPYNRYKITIECDGKTTTARMEINGKEVKTAQAKRNPADAFNWRTGAETAFGRLWGKRGNEGKRGQPFRVGDRVVCMLAVDGNESVVGKHGKIVEDWIGGGNRFAVDFDDKLECGHDCMMRAKPGHGWNCPANAMRRE